MEFFVWLALLAVMSAVSWALGERKGFIAWIALLVVGIILFAARSPKEAEALAFVASFAAPLIVAALAAGAFTGAMLRQRRYGVALVLALTGAVFLGKPFFDRQAEANEHEQVVDFMWKNTQLARLTGGTPKFRLSSSTKYSDTSRATYEFRLEARQPLYAIVEVDRSTKPSTLKLRCVTSRYLGKRTSRDPCAADVVSLDDPTWAAAPAAAASATPIPEVPALPRDAHVHVIGVYEAKNRPRIAGSPHEPGEIEVTVSPAETPLILVLTSYEPVRWNVKNLGRPISAVFTSGYYPSTVSGVDAKVANIGREYLSDRGRASEEAFRIRMRAHSRGPFSSQATYYGTEFTVPAN